MFSSIAIIVVVRFKPRAARFDLNQKTNMKNSNIGKNGENSMMACHPVSKVSRLWPILFHPLVRTPFQTNTKQILTTQTPHHCSSKQ